MLEVGAPVAAQMRQERGYREVMKSRFTEWDEVIGAEAAA